MVILANPNITYTATPVLEPSIAGVQSLSYLKYSSNSTAIKFTQFTVSGQSTTDLYGLFCHNTNQIHNVPIAELASPYFAIKNVNVFTQTSLYPDEYLLDFYIASFNKINDPYPQFRELLLYNAYTLVNGQLATLAFSMVNHWTNPALSVGNNGALFPTMIRLAGQVSSSEVVLLYIYILLKLIILFKKYLFIILLQIY